MLGIYVLECFNADVESFVFGLYVFDFGIRLFIFVCEFGKLFTLFLVNSINSPFLLLDLVYNPISLTILLHELPQLLGLLLINSINILQ